MQDLKALLERLLKNKVDFVLIGGFAGVTHGTTIVTQDLDICAAITTDTISLLRNALRDLNPVHRMNPNFKPSFLQEPKDATGINHIYLETDLGILDILSEVPPAGTFQQLRERALEIKLYGYSCKVISLDDLIKVKESMKRPKDVATLQELKLLRARQKK